MIFRKIASLHLAGLMLLIALPASAETTGECGLLSRNLKIGMSGHDVRELQVILNKNMATRIALFGVGSPGNESNFFGTRTKTAVTKFQELYSKELLVPIGLTKGTGFVGQFTLNKLRRNCDEVPATPIASSSRVLPPSLQKADNTPREVISSSIERPTIDDNVQLLHVKYPLRYAIKPGETLTVLGGGFTAKDNIIYVGNKAYPGISQYEFGQLELTIPMNSPTGKFEVWVKNAKGESNRTFVVIVAKGLIAPKVTSFTPRSGFAGVDITATGVGFSKEWNDVFIGSKVIRVASPDGKTLTFSSMIDFPGVTPGVDTANIDGSLPLWFYIVNTGGISNVSIFTAKI